MYSNMYDTVLRYLSEVKMDMQLKKGVLEILVLATLSQNDSYGYKIVQSLSSIIDISESTLYPILRRLETSGKLTVYNAEHNGRLRKYYKCTFAGRQRVREFMSEWKDFEKILTYIASTINGGNL